MSEQEVRSRSVRISFARAIVDLITTLASLALMALAVFHHEWSQAAFWLIVFTFHGGEQRG